MLIYLFWGKLGRIEAIYMYVYFYAFNTLQS